MIEVRKRRDKQYTPEYKQKVREMLDLIYNECLKDKHVALSHTARTIKIAQTVFTIISRDYLTKINKNKYIWNVRKPDDQMVDEVLKACYEYNREMEYALRLKRAEEMKAAIVKSEEEKIDLLHQSYVPNEPVDDEVKYGSKPFPKGNEFNVWFLRLKDLHLSKADIIKYLNNPSCASKVAHVNPIPFYTDDERAEYLMYQFKNRGVKAPVVEEYQPTKPTVGKIQPELISCTPVKSNPQPMQTMLDMPDTPMKKPLEEIKEVIDYAAEKARDARARLKKQADEVGGGDAMYHQADVVVEIERPGPGADHDIDKKFEPTQGLHSLPTEKKKEVVKEISILWGAFKFKVYGNK